MRIDCTGTSVLAGSRYALGLSHTGDSVRSSRDDLHETVGGVYESDAVGAVVGILRCVLLFPDAEPEEGGRERGLRDLERRGHGVDGDDRGAVFSRANERAEGGRDCCDHRRGGGVARVRRNRLIGYIQAVRAWSASQKIYIIFVARFGNCWKITE